MTTAVVELVLRWPEPVEQIEQIWLARETARRWDTTDDTCERLLAWLRQEAS